MTPGSFVDALANVRLSSVFNPYRDHCRIYDYPDSAARRKRNLENFLTAALDHGVDTIWIARDLGYRGGRRTGIPLTDEKHLDRIGCLLGGISIERATRGPAFEERTATVVWKVITRIGHPILLWNVFPLHPHNPGNPFSNRRHTLAERRETSVFLPDLIDMVKPKLLVAIGRDAQQALDNTNLHVVGIRHPSYGGQSDFVADVLDLYGSPNAISSTPDASR